MPFYGSSDVQVYLSLRLILGLVTLHNILLDSIRQKVLFTRLTSCVYMHLYVEGLQMATSHKIANDTPCIIINFKRIIEIGYTVFTIASYVRCFTTKSD